MTKTKGQHSEAWHIEIRGRFLDGYGTQHIPSPPDTLREAFRAQVIFLIFGQAGFIFFSFLQKTMKRRSDFHCRIPIVKVAVWDVFRADAKIFDFWPDWLYFLFFFAKNNEKNVGFPLLSSCCKSSSLGSFSGRGENFRCWAIFALFSFAPPNHNITRGWGSGLEHNLAIKTRALNDRNRPHTAKDQTFDQTAWEIRERRVHMEDTICVRMSRGAAIRDVIVFCVGCVV